MQPKQRVLSLYWMAVLLLLFSFDSHVGFAKTHCPQTSSTPFADTSYRVIPAQDHTYGYEIFTNRKVMIRQQIVPGLPGIRGFKRKQDAEEIAKLVIKKITRNIMSPSINKEELDSLKVKC